MKYIDTIEIKNFKSIRHQKIEGCKRINVFIGYPNVGKSNILEALGLFSFLRLTKENFQLRDICRVKHLSELFFNQDYKEQVNISINDAVELNLRIDQLSEIFIEIGIKEIDQGSVFRKNIFSIKTSDSVKAGASYPDVHESLYTELIPVIKKYNFENNSVLNQRGPYSLSIPFGRNLLDILQGFPELREDIKNIFEMYQLKLFIDRADESLKFFKELNDGTAISVPYHQIADTLRRLIFFKATIHTNTNTALLFEEPEAHMFPPYVRKFTADVILDKTNQFFIATHSPYVLDSLMEDAMDDLAIFLVYYENGETKLKRLEEKDMKEISEYGVDLFYNLESYLNNGQINNA